MIRDFEGDFEGGFVLLQLAGEMSGALAIGVIMRVEKSLELFIFSTDRAHVHM